MSVRDIPQAKSCPACGCEAELHTKCVRGSNKYWIECGGCFIRTAQYWTQEEAVDEWNSIEVEKDDEDETSDVTILKAQIELLKRELDAAIRDLKAIEATEGNLDFCVYCKYNKGNDRCACSQCDPYNGKSAWEWRGAPQEVERE